MNEIELLQDVVNTWGLDMQKIVCMEECGELIQALAKSMRPTREKSWKTHHDDLNNIAEEIADVELCIAQMKVGMPEIESDVESIKARKLYRLQMRLAHSKDRCAE